MNLIVYDSSGYIYSQMYGVYKVPSGIPYLEIEVPTGKYIESVNTSVTPNVPIYKDIQPSQMELLQAQIDALVLRADNNEEIGMMALEATAVIYEAVAPFLPSTV